MVHISTILKMHCNQTMINYLSRCIYRGSSLICLDSRQRPDFNWISRLPRLLPLQYWHSLYVISPPSALQSWFVPSPMSPLPVGLVMWPSLAYSFPAGPILLSTVSEPEGFADHWNSFFKIPVEKPLSEKSTKRKESNRMFHLRMQE